MNEEKLRRIKMIIDLKKRGRGEKRDKEEETCWYFFLSFLSFGYCKVHKPHPSPPQPSAFQPHQTSKNTKRLGITVVTCLL